MANKLIERIAEKGYSLEAIAGELCITPDELQKKISGETDFVYSEMYFLRNLLELTNKEVGAFFFGEGQEEADEETEKQNERRNFHLIAALRKALDEINTNNTRLVSLLDLLSRCSDMDMSYDTISLNDIALSFARETNRLIDEAQKECGKAY